MGASQHTGAAVLASDSVGSAHASLCQHWPLHVCHVQVTTTADTPADRLPGGGGGGPPSDRTAASRRPQSPSAPSIALLLIPALRAHEALWHAGATPRPAPPPALPPCRLSAPPVLNTSLAEAPHPNHAPPCSAQPQAAPAVPRVGAAVPASAREDQAVQPDPHHPQARQRRRQAGHGCRGEGPATDVVVMLRRH